MLGFEKRKPNTIITILDGGLHCVDYPMLSNRNRSPFSNFLTHDLPKLTCHFHFLRLVMAEIILCTRITISKSTFDWRNYTLLIMKFYLFRYVNVICKFSSQYHLKKLKKNESEASDCIIVSLRWWSKNQLVTR